MTEEIISQIDDRLEKRFEAYAQTQIKLHEEAHKRILESVNKQIIETVNGKIDGIKKDVSEIKTQMNGQDVILKSLDYRIKPFEYGVSWFESAKIGLSWLAGFITPIAIIGGAITFFYKLLK